MSLSQLKLLVILTDHFPAAMKLKDLASELHITPGAASQIVDGLCHQGFIQRRHDETDRRSIAISMSAEGQESLRHFHALVSDSLGTFLSAVPEDKLAIFMDVLAELNSRTFADAVQPADDATLTQSPAASPSIP